MKPTLDRIEYRVDQCLDRSDLAQWSRRTAELLELHTARGHDVWGVASGYVCELDTAAERVSVGAGIAVDARGRQLINASSRQVPYPVVPRGGGAFVFDLVARWADGLVPDCDLRGMPAERATLRWVCAGPANDDGVGYSPRVQLGLDVPITRLTTDASGTPTSVDSHARPVAHALTRPKIASGRVLQATCSVSDKYADWSMWVPTTSAGFQYASSPVYLVTLDAHPFGETATLRGLPAKFDLAQRLAWRGPYVSIARKDYSGFLLRVVTEAPAGSWATTTDAATNPVAVSWVGIDTSDPGPPDEFWFPLLGFVLPMFEVIG